MNWSMHFCSALWFRRSSVYLDRIQYVSLGGSLKFTVHPPVLTALLPACLCLSVSVFVSGRHLFSSWFLERHPDNQLELLCHLPRDLTAAELPSLRESVKDQCKAQSFRRYPEAAFSFRGKV